MQSVTKKGLVTLLGLILSAPVIAYDTGVKGLTQNGRIKVGASVLYDLPHQGNKMGPANWVLESKTTYRPNRTWSFIGNFWLRGDLSTSYTNYDSPNGGLPAQPNIMDNARFSLNSKNCAPGVYCSDMNDGLEVLDDWEDIIRELSVKYKDKKRRFSVKVGRFQRGWGQSDGLRLMDVLHAQDLRQRFAFTDSDELRLPALMLSADFNFRKLGIDGPFKAIGMKNTSLEFNFVPETRVSEFIINNPTPSDRSSGGIFGLDWADVNDGETGAGLVGLSFNLHDNKPKRLSFSDAEYSMRLKFDVLGGQGTLNAFYGMQDLPVSKLLGSTLIIGNGLNDPSAPGASMPLPTFDAATTEAIVHAPGGYLHWLRSVAKGAPIQSPLSALTDGLGFGAAGCADLPVAFGGTGLGAGTQGCSIAGEVELDFDYRQTMVGFSFTRDLSDFVSWGRKSSAPTIRIEMSHEFDHPFNRSMVNPGAVFDASALFGAPPGAVVFDAGVNVDPITGIPGGANLGEMGSGVLAVQASRNIVKEDITSTMVGFDFPLWVPGWETQTKSIFTSLQLFDIYTHNSDQGLLQQSPYAFTEIQDHQNFMTFAWNMALDSERLVFDGLYIRDFQGKGNFYRQRVDFNYFGNSWRPRIELVHFEGKKESAPLGTFNNSDYLEASLTYQF